MVKATSVLREPLLTARGYAGRGRGGEGYVERPPEFSGTTVQVCGLYPYSVGASAPTIGVPWGPHLLTGATVCCDPISWFERAKLILNPSMFVLGLPHVGKSTLIGRLMIGLTGSGVVPLVLGDLKPDHVDRVRALGGQVVKLGRGLGSLNVVDSGPLEEAADRLAAAGHTGEAERLREEGLGRRLTAVLALVELVRHRRTTETEEAVLAAALRLLAARHRAAGAGGRAPLLGDLVAVLEEGPEPVRLPTLDRGDERRYREAVDPLQRSILALLDGPVGAVFARPTTERLRLDAPAAAFDISGISASDTDLSAAVLLACWSEGFGQVEAANALADAGLAPQRRFFVVMDELWRVIRSGYGMVDRVDSLTRLNRNHGVGQAMISHSLADLRSLSNAEDVAKAKGFVERAGLVVLGGLPRQELDEVREVVDLSRAEIDTVTSWSTPPGWSPGEAHPGQGRFLIKSGQRAGIPVQLQLTHAEKAAGGLNTNRRWAVR